MRRALFSYGVLLVGGFILLIRSFGWLGHELRCITASKEEDRLFPSTKPAVAILAMVGTSCVGMALYILNITLVLPAFMFVLHLASAIHRQACSARDASSGPAAVSGTRCREDLALLRRHPLRYSNRAPRTRDAGRNGRVCVCWEPRDRRVLWHRRIGAPSRQEVRQRGRNRSRDRNDRVCSYPAATTGPQECDVYSRRREGPISVSGPGIRLPRSCRWPCTRCHEHWGCRCCRRQPAWPRRSS